jgi:hypothetical protein
VSLGTRTTSPSSIRRVCHSERSRSISSCAPFSGASARAVEESLRCIGRKGRPRRAFPL